MNADVKNPAARWLVLVAALAWGHAGAIGFEDDPLQTEPPVLKEGFALPDGHVVSCPAALDLTGPLALGHVIDLALCNNSQIKQAWASIKAQASAVGEARAAFLPTANASVSRQKTRVTYPDFSDANRSNTGRVASANMNWRLFDFGGRSANLDASNFLLEAALASHHASIQRAMANVIQAYFDALTSKASLDAKEKSVALARATWEATLRREGKGASARSDSLQAESALAHAELSASRASGE